MTTPSGVERGGVSLSTVLLQVCFTAMALVLWQEPIIQPIKLLVVLLHEMSHGLMALASGGTVHDIIITPDEGGACRSTGGNGLLVAGAGYLGSMFFGGMILRAARGGSSVPVTFAVLALLLLGAAVTVLQDSYSRTFAFAVAGAFIFFGLLAPGFLGAVALRAIGTVSCLYALFDIYSDLVAGEGGAGSVPNDAEAFASLTGIPAETIGLLWLVVSAAFLLAIVRASLDAPPQPARTAAPAATRAA